MKMFRLLALLLCIDGMLFVSGAPPSLAQNIPLVINSGVPQQLPVANTLVDASGNPFGLMIGSFTPGHCLASGGGKQIVDSGVAGCTGGGGGGVTSVGLTMPSFFSVSGSPVTTSGTLAVTANNQGIDTHLSGPCTGSPASPTFRALCVQDINSGSGASSSTWLRGDFTWQPLPAAHVAYSGAQCASSPTTGTFAGSTNPGALTMTNSTPGVFIGTNASGAVAVSYWYMAAPSLPFSIYMRHEPIVMNPNILGGVGIGFSAGINSTIDAFTYNGGHNTMGWTLGTWTNATTPSNANYRGTINYSPEPWARIDFSVSATKYYTSTTGYDWTLVDTESGGGPSYIGVIVENEVGADYQGNHDLSSEIECFSTTAPS